MISHRKIRWKNRLISWVPGLRGLGDALRVLEAARQWQRDGWTAPPPYFVRRAMLRTEARACGARCFVETGTFLGDTSWALAKEFRKVYTIEVEPTLAALARERFRKRPEVAVVEGDSALLLPGICREIDSACLFYLDGHYSGGITGMGGEECPILAELRAIFDHTAHPFRIVIDDARLFGTSPAYPTIEAIAGLLRERAPDKSMRVENDAILIF